MSKRSHISHAEWALHVGGNRTVLMGSFEPETIQHYDGAIFHLEKANLSPERINKMGGNASLVYTTPETIDRFVYKKSQHLGINLAVANKTNLIDAAEGSALIARQPYVFSPLKDRHIDFRGHHEEQMVVVSHDPEEAANILRQLVGLGVLDVKSAGRTFVWSAYQAQEPHATFECTVPIPQAHEAKVHDSIKLPPSREFFVRSQPLVLQHQPEKTMLDGLRDTILDLSGACQLGTRGPAKDGYAFTELSKDTLARLSPVTHEIMTDPQERFYDHPARGKV